MKKKMKLYFTVKPKGICAIIFTYLFFKIESQYGLMRDNYFMKLFCTIIYSKLNYIHRYESTHIETTSTLGMDNSSFTHLFNIILKMKKISADTFLLCMF